MRASTQEVGPMGGDCPERRDGDSRDRPDPLRQTPSRVREDAGLPGGPRRARRRRDRPRRGGRLRLVHHGGDRRGRGRQGHRRRRRHLLLQGRLRRRRFLRDRRPTSRRPSPPARPAWASPGGRASAAAAPRPWTNTAVQLAHPGPVDPAVRPAAPRRRDRACSPAATCTSTARTRDHLVQRRAGLPQPRQPEPGRDDVRHAR